MDEREWLSGQFEAHRARLRAVAFRMLGSAAEADDAVQDAWLRVDRAGADGVDNLGAWLTTIVARVCLNQLRSRTMRREDPLDVHVPDPIVSPAAGVDPEHEALLADSVGLALLVVLDTLTPAERLAFVLHDMFAVPFEDIAPMLERTPAAARQLSSRARRRVQGRPTAPDPDVARQRAVVDAFFAASRSGDFAALVELLDPDVILRSDGGPSRAKFTFTLHGPEQVATQALASSRLSPFVYPALVNGAAGVVVATAPDRPLFVMAFTVTAGRIVAVDVLADPDRLRTLVTLPLDGTVGA
ncbi:sigma-70 family RNA polymerase sigma factor [Dactylosporangium matsuzakiense]|uniref:DNA-directed RNA polymerase sigma-70 factor n=1 Tax=Dactylosporangium matsuzakiense TaxID=53360 RepID=A0A9W6KVA5_9ACTN|nr:sigma-70 family RNA polymerase sigma factor [Dactylosporangium matsuzakiense]UWZ47612.1 sigma-70 family RNA polymerase sigma factor [Dactylosporangium matsuzakiense]GLL08732.1 DNA-directed RNA polymerase sigma-70 factor [Dactylosporangium matsuzakiense]